MNHQNAGQSDDFAESDTSNSVNSTTLNECLQGAVDQHEHLLVRYSRQFVGDVETARDVVQDTFMTLCHYEKTQERRVGSQLRKWLYKVCRNRAIDVARKENRMKTAPTNQFDETVLLRSLRPTSRQRGLERKLLASFRVFESDFDCVQSDLSVTIMFKVLTKRLSAAVQ